MIEVTSLPPDSTVENILEVIDRDGACILTDALDASARQTAIAEISPFVRRTRYGDKDFSGNRTKRTGALIARSPAVREIVLASNVSGTANAFLLRNSDRIQLNLTQTIAIEPGQGDQPLHRDRFGWGNFIPREIEPQFNAIWALSDFTADNGATRVAPGSHKWEWDRKAEPHETCHAEMPKGSVLLHTGSVLHSGGENRTKATRLGLNITYCLGWLRQEENQYLSCPPDIARTLSRELQEILGYTQGNYALGYYSDPDGRETDDAGILAPEVAVGSAPRTKWIFTEDGYKPTENSA